MQQCDLTTVCKATLWGDLHLKKKLGGMHTRTETQLQDNMPHTLSPGLRQQELLQMSENDCDCFVFGFFTPFRLVVKTPTCKAVHADAACHLSTASATDCFCNRESRESQPRSASCCRSSLLPSTHKPVLSLCFVYRKRWGLDTLHSQRSKKHKTKQR